MPLILENPETERVARLRRFLEEEVWPQIPSDIRGKTLTKTEEEEVLGYDSDLDLA